jgi:aryl-alcohol dehydrogenase-like predicted oxidoreductase
MMPEKDREPMMQTDISRPLGISGLSVSPLGVGTNRWVYGKNNEQVIKTFQASVIAGICFFDSAEIYGFGKSERLLGECLRQSGNQVVVASKFVPLPTHHFNKALDGTLSRLGLQTLDLYYIHFPIGNIETLMDQMAQAVDQGKIRAIGVSNFSASQMHKAADRLARHNLTLAANEVQYNLLHRQPETNGVLEACRELNVALVSYFPMASGKLTKSKPQSRSFSTSPIAGDLDLQETLQKIAVSRGKSVSQVILNWLLQKDDHIIPIPGATSAAHAINNAETLNWKLTEDEFDLIDQTSRPLNA